MLICPNTVGRLVLIQALPSRKGFVANLKNVEIWQTCFSLFLTVNDDDDVFFIYISEIF